MLQLLRTLSATTPTPAIAGTPDCETMRATLCQAVGRTAADLRAELPVTAWHLTWCRACGARLAELTAVEADAAAGTYGPPLLAQPPLWKDVVTGSGERVRELVSAIVVAWQRALLRIATPPGIAVHALDGGGAMRGGTRGGSARRLEIDLDARTRVTCDVAVASGGAVTVALRVDGARALREVAQAAVTGAVEQIESIVAAAGNTAVLRDLPAGAHVITLVTTNGDRWRMPLSIEAPA